MKLFGEKKPSRRDLERHLENGRNLIHKVTQRIEAYAKENTILREQLKSANTYLACCIYNEFESENSEITFNRASLERAMKTLKIVGTESEDKKHITLKVEVRPVEEEAAQNCRHPDILNCANCPEDECKSCEKVVLEQFEDVACRGCDKTFNPSIGGGTIEKLPYCEDCLNEVLAMYKIKGIEVLANDGINYSLRSTGPESDNDNSTSEESSGELVHSEIEAGGDQTQEDQGDVIVSRSNSLDVQGEADAGGICSTDTQDIPENDS